MLLIMLALSLVLLTAVPTTPVEPRVSLKDVRAQLKKGQWCEAAWVADDFMAVEGSNAESHFLRALAEASGCYLQTCAGCSSASDCANPHRCSPPSRMTEMLAWLKAHKSDKGVQAFRDRLRREPGMLQFTAQPAFRELLDLPALSVMTIEARLLEHTGWWHESDRFAVEFKPQGVATLHGIDGYGGCTRTKLAGRWSTDEQGRVLVTFTPDDIVDWVSPITLTLAAEHQSMVGILGPHRAGTFYQGQIPPPDGCRPAAPAGRPSR